MSSQTDEKEGEGREWGDGWESSRGESIGASTQLAKCLFTVTHACLPGAGQAETGRSLVLPGHLVYPNQ